MNKIENHLATCRIARNDNKLGYIRLLQKYYCKNNIEKAIIERILLEAMSQATYKRQVAYIQNTLGLYQSDFEIKEIRQQQEEKIHNEYSNGLFDAVARFFRKF